MKHWLGIVALICFGSRVHAAPYFRPLDLSRIKPVAGALLDPIGSAPNDAVGMLPLVTHSPDDGCLFPSIVCEDWSPLAVGLGGNLRSDPYVSVGPIINVAPVAKALILACLNVASSDSQLVNIKDSLRPVVGSDGFDVALSAGPAYVIKPQENFKGYFRIFIGGALKF